MFVEYNMLRKIIVITSDCNLGIEFSIPGFGIEKFVISGSHFGIRLTECTQITVHRKSWALTRIKYFIY